MSQRQELVALAGKDGVNLASLARRFGVSRKTIYKWLKRHELQGAQGLVDKSRRPHRSPRQTSEQTEQAILAQRAKHPAWGGRKLHHVLKRDQTDAPAPSTITRILHTHGLIEPAASAQRHHWQRFEYDAPNDLWQMDFKSPVELIHGGLCYPLTVLDDHSRYALGLEACPNEQHQTVRDQLTRLFTRYGLPWSILSDNGSPWGAPGSGAYTRLEVWLMRLDIRMRHGRPYHPQTQGKDERFHRTINVEVLQGRDFRDRMSLQAAFDPWREVYNHERPHEALDMQRPGDRYQPSSRSLPNVLPAIEFDAADEVRRVDASGQFRFHRRKCRAGKAFYGESIGLRATSCDGLWDVYFGRFRIGQVDLNRVGANEFVHVLRGVSSRCAPSATPEHEKSL